MTKLTIDRSRAIKVADELTNQTLHNHHLQVFNYKPLLNFLSRGDLSLFVYKENDTPIDILCALELDEDFVEWLSDIFYKQYDLIFLAAILSKNKNVTKAILDGRRFVSERYENKCFATAIRYNSELLDELKVEQDKAERIPAPNLPLKDC